MGRTAERFPDAAGSGGIAMRICVLNPYYHPYQGGIERRIRSTARRLAEDHDVHVVTAQLPETDAGTSRDDGIHVHRLPSRFPLEGVYNPPPVMTPGLGDALDELDPDVLDLHYRWAPGYARAFREADVPAKVVTYHNTFGEGRGLAGLASYVNDWWFLDTLECADRIVCISAYIRRVLADHGIDEDRLPVVYNAIEPGPIREADGSPAIDARPYVVTVGRLVATKGHEVAIDAIADLPDVHLVIVGEGGRAPWLKLRARWRGVRDRVHLTGWIDEAEKNRLLKHCAAYVHPAHQESFGLAVLEALTAGAPTIAAEVGGIPEVVGDAGILLDHDPAEWAEAIRRIVEDDEERARLSERARKQAETFSWDRAARELVEVYEESLDRS